MVLTTDWKPQKKKKFSDLEDRVIEAIQTEIYREKTEKEMKDLHDV